MPTTSLGIFYPCEGDLINLNDFYNHALTVETALSGTFTQSVPLLNRDFVAGFAFNPTVAVNVTTTVSWNTPSAANNPSGMFNPGTPTVFTLQSAGSYLIAATFSASPVTTVASLRGAVLLDGVEQIWEKLPSDGSALFPSFDVSGLLVAASAGQQVSVTVLWGGTGGPATPSVNIRIVKISDI